MTQMPVTNGVVWQRALMLGRWFASTDRGWRATLLGLSIALVAVLVAP